jgi:ferredoxin/flavodoxin---NADP+ reductase
LYTILLKRKLNALVTLMEIDAPYVANKARPGQFIILRIDDQGERIPLTIADYDRERGTITIIYQVVGGTTKQLDTLEEGDSILDFVGPLGEATEIDKVKKIAVIGGGVGCAIAYPQAKALHHSGVSVDVITGFRNKDAVILEDEFRNVCENLIICTDDGSYQNKGLVTEYLQKRIDEGILYDLVIAIGPIPMMKYVSKVTEPYAIKTIVSLNPIMIDGTGMCGGCRVIVNHETKFACIDGPDFDGHQVDFDDLTLRNKAYKKQEQQALTTCRLTGGVCFE